MSGTYITCKTCGQSFLWSYGEQRFFKERGLEPPKHCKACIEQGKRARDSGMRSEVGPTVEFPPPDVQPMPPRMVQPPATRFPATPQIQRSPQHYQPAPKHWWHRPGNRSTVIVFWLVLVLVLFKGLGWPAALLAVIAGVALYIWLEQPH